MVIKATAMHVPPTFYFGTFLSRALHDYDCQATDVETPNATFRAWNSTARKFTYI